MDKDMELTNLRIENKKLKDSLFEKTEENVSYFHSCNNLQERLTEVTREKERLLSIIDSLSSGFANMKH